MSRILHLQCKKRDLKVSEVSECHETTPNGDFSRWFRELHDTYDTSDTF